MKTFPIKIVVDGDCEGEPVVINRSISFFGEVDPVKGIVRPENISITGKALVFRGSRGSTVGSYIIYALKYYGKSPSCMIVENAEPILITGCVLSDTPLFVVYNYNELTRHVLEKTRTIIHKKGQKHIVLLS
ncbi:aconitase X swivel domain-containing protein [Staphylothermus hellenicus]|uniref:Phosphomevalonate dehydratase small subunit-like domain-containing protein n=1 Tax=Staphylothermus hellenicus (strain DSM 12710 / JCM 10830 / BK20S6-10-b1 / P8) TaxID=591019 RepID=D7DAW8_STAHD|nr:DUF126 domain-containing protein [Staphylothermus hellenicus]ADI31315.1 protein of unknown function DUF126 [Staphylothermus hellenicus DSM 12710]